MALSKALKTSPIFQPALLTSLEGARPGRLVTHSSRWNTKAVSLIGLQSILYLYVYMSIWNTHDYQQHAYLSWNLHTIPTENPRSDELIQISAWYLRPKFESGQHICITTAYANPYIQLGGMIPRLFLNFTTPLHDMFFPGDMWRNPTQVRLSFLKPTMKDPPHEASDAITMRSHILTCTWPFLLKKKSDMCWKRHPASYSEVMMV